MKPTKQTKGKPDKKPGFILHTINLTANDA